MRAAAEVEPVALLVDRDFLVGGNGVDQFDLERLAMGLEPGFGFIARPFLAHDRFVGGDDLAHLFFDGGEVFRRKRLGAEKVIVKTVFDHRADGDLRARKNRLHRIGQHMGGVVADQLQRTGIVTPDEFEPRIGVDGGGEVRELAVEDHGHGAFGQRGRNALGDVDAGNAGFERTLRAIGKGNRDHKLSPVLSRRDEPA